MKKNKKNLVGSPGQPQAWIAIHKNRQKSNSGGKVYFKDRQEFEIELFNPTKSPTLVKIKLNGNYISNRGLILDPGQRWFLDRYIDNDRKFSFSTYDIENNEETKEAISNNGLVEVEFYPETINFGNGGINWGKPYWEKDWSQPGIWYSGTGTGGFDGPFFTTTSLFSDLSNIDSSEMITKTATYSSSIDISEVANNGGEKKDSLLETGRVKEGGKSGQSFSEGSGTFDSFTSNICRYKIIPISTKPLKKSEMRNYCTNCSLRIRKSSWKFCPSCGENLQ